MFKTTGFPAISRIIWSWSSWKQPVGTSWLDWSLGTSIQVRCDQLIIKPVNRLRRPGLHPASSKINYLRPQRTWMEIESTCGIPTIFPTSNILRNPRNAQPGKNRNMQQLVIRSAQSTHHWLVYQVYHLLLKLSISKDIKLNTIYFFAGDISP
jgi:hypothetical protein